MRTERQTPQWFVKVDVWSCFSGATTIILITARLSIDYSNMRRIGPRPERAPHRILAVVALAAVLLLAANPAALLLSPESASAVGAEAPQIAQQPCSGECHFLGGLSVASIFPISSDRKVPEKSDPEVVGLADDQADDLFAVLSSGTAREILLQLTEEPQTASELSDTVDTSLQNIHYHLENLHDAGAIAELSVEYSERGREMSVYTAACTPQLMVYDIP